VTCGPVVHIVEVTTFTNVEFVSQSSRLFTLPPIVMEVENYLNERKLILEGPIFHFHDYGRNGMAS